jgi:hypothetical protein
VNAKQAKRWVNGSEISSYSLAFSISFPKYNVETANGAVINN